MKFFIIILLFQVLFFGSKEKQVNEDSITCSVVYSTETKEPNFKNIEVVYIFPDFLHPKLFIYSDSTKTKLIDSVETNTVMASSRNIESWLKKLEKSNWKPKKFIKTTEEVIKFDSYYLVTAANFDIDYRHEIYDVLIWKQEFNELKLITHYPEFIGGCLYCGVTMSTNIDTIIFNVTGGDDGGEYGSIKKYLFLNEKLRKIFVQVYSGINHDGRYNIFYKNYYYDHNEKLLKSSIDFVNQSDGKDIYAHPKSDSLDLHLLTADYMPYEPKLVKTVYVKEDSIKIGKLISNKATVLWENKWYITYMKYLSFK